MVQTEREVSGHALKGTGLVTEIWCLTRLVLPSSRSLSAKISWNSISNSFTCCWRLLLQFLIELRSTRSTTNFPLCTSSSAFCFSVSGVSSWGWSQPSSYILLGAIIAGTKLAAEMTPITILAGSCTGLFESFVTCIFTFEDPGFKSVYTGVTLYFPSFSP